MYYHKFRFCTECAEDTDRFQLVFNSSSDEDYCSRGHFAKTTKLVDIPVVNYEPRYNVRDVEKKCTHFAYSNGDFRFKH